MIRNNKRGVSEIVSTVLIIMLTVATIEIIWVGVLPMVKDNLIRSDICNNVDISIENNQGYTCYSSSNITIIQIKKGSNDVNVSGVKFYLSSEGNSIPFTTNDSLKRNSFSVFYLNTTGISKLDNLKVAPIVKSGSNEKICAAVYFTQLLSACSSALTEEEVAKITHGGGHVINQDPIVIMSCVPNCSCADSVAVGETCSDGCGGMTCQGTKQDGTVSYPYVITNCTQLQNMNQNLSANYVLANNIDCSDTKNWNWNTTLNAYQGFVPIASCGVSNGFVPCDNPVFTFRGNFNGNNNNISNLTIYLPSTDYVGLFAKVYNAPLINFTLLNVNITGRNYVGGIAGLREMDAPLLSTVDVTGSVIGLTKDKVRYVGLLYGKDIYKGPHILG